MGETKNVMSFSLDVQAINISLIGVFELASIQMLPQELLFHHWHCFDEIDILINFTINLTIILTQKEDWNHLYLLHIFFQWNIEFWLQ